MEELRQAGIMDVLAARDERVETQKALLEKYAKPLVSFTMNIAGSIKNDPAIQRAFHEGVNRIEACLKGMKAEILDTRRKIAFTGCEQVWVVNAPAAALKNSMERIEEADELGRLFDIDVLDAGGAKLSRGDRGEGRKCLICKGPVSACARSRAHSGEELFKKAHEIIDGYFVRKDASSIAMHAQRALLHEAMTTPKPGLVDRENSGAHRDMDLFTFADSACALRDYFEKCARAGLENTGDDLKAVFEKLRCFGQWAEADMMRITGGVNTHKGALFSMGILCCAAGMRAKEGASVDDIFGIAARIAEHSLNDFEVLSMKNAVTGGERQFVSMGLKGVRGEAAAGFPSVRHVALPELERALSQGKSLNDASLCALIALMAKVQDSNIIRRGGMDSQKSVMEAAGRLIKEGFSADELRMMNDEFVRDNISPGGCADLLAIALFFHFLKKDQ